MKENSNMSVNIQIQQFTQSDWSYIATIYQEGIDTGMATFETKNS